MINWSVLVLIFFKWIFCLLVLEKFDRNIVLKYGLYVVKIIWWVVILCLFIMSVILDNFFCCFILFNIFKIFLGRDFLMIIVEVEFIVVGMKGKSYMIDVFCCLVCCWYWKIKGGWELVWIKRIGKRKWIYVLVRLFYIVVFLVYNSFNRVLNDNYVEYVI